MLIGKWAKGGVRSVSVTLTYTKYVREGKVKDKVGHLRVARLAVLLVNLLTNIPTAFFLFFLNGKYTHNFFFLQYTVILIITHKFKKLFWINCYGLC